MTTTKSESSFWKEFIEGTTPCGRHRKHGETRMLCRMLDDKTLRVQKIISLNPFNANATASWLCGLADKYGVTMTGTAQPTIVGPSVLGEDKYYVGLSLDRLVKWYAHFGFEAVEIDGQFQVTRRPKNEVQD